MCKDMLNNTCLGTGYLRAVLVSRAAMDALLGILF